MTKTKDKRIANWNSVHSISISSYNVNEKKWKREIRKEKAYYFVLSLCTLNGNISLSSGYDRLIKVWTISDIELTFIKEIKEHTSDITKVIPLSEERSASCSTNMTVKV